MKHSILTASALLASLLMTGSLLSCGDQDASATETTAAVGETTSAVTETTAEGEALYTEKLITQDFGGAAIRIASSNDLVGYEIPTTIQFATEETGEIVNDTLYARDLWIEENGTGQIKQNMV